MSENEIHISVAAIPVGVNLLKKNNFKHWTESDLEFLRKNYSNKGKMWCVEQLGKSESAIRCQASKMGLKQTYSGEFFRDWQRRAAQSKVGKKRPDAAENMRRLYREGKINKQQFTPQRRREMSWRSRCNIVLRGHPRGMLGKKHSPEVCEKMSALQRMRWKSMTDDDVAARTLKSAITRVAKGTPLPMRLNASWKAGWRVIGGQRIFFRSRWEANYGRYLQFLLQNKVILKWEHEPETFWFEGVKRGCVSYLPDFRVTELDGTVKYHEVKGWMDDRSKTKIKRMKIYHPEVFLRVVDSKTYRELSRKLSGIVPEWERGEKC